MKPDYIKLDLPHELISNVCNISTWIKDNNEFQFVPVEYEQIHMTICFLSNYIKKNKKESIVYEMMNKFPFDNTEIKFKKYALFPESKENLIVAIFDTSITFHTNVINFQKNVYNKLGITDNEQYHFTAHITLGKIMNKNDKTIVNLNVIPHINASFIPHNFLLEKQ
ncbi:RNA ligase domain containing protein [Bodo saltans virus]|uniref:RNA ligase domain containing protein n=1 Tax=Bodo saltans virus TaxID=2024608 RepID=A0A2H4UUH8_9VIRU|nr:RNA ligase domain containing protein [Bodo saltans virus]ATZ80524.1 RNA ligase domain containing protein [Bodo saltans virus]